MDEVGKHAKSLASKISAGAAATVTEAVYEAKVWADYAKKVTLDDVRREQKKVLDIWEPIVLAATGGRRPSYLPDGDDIGTSGTGGSDGSGPGGGGGGESGSYARDDDDDDDDDDHLEL
jgi:hypothetical protein